MVALLMSGCNGEESSETNGTIEEAIIQSEVSNEDVFFIKEFDQDAAAFFQVGNEVGVLHLSNLEDGWEQRGYSSFTAMNEDTSPLIYMMSTSLS